MRIGLMLSMPGDLTGTKGLVERAQRAELDGFSSTWIPQVSGLDAMTVLALTGRETNRIELGTAVVPTYPRHPTVTAMGALTVQDASDGRFALGIGLSHRFSIENSLGLDYSHPIPHMRDYLTILNGLLSGERVTHEGQMYRVNAQVNVPDAKKPPVLVAALGPDMLKLCGRLADGTITWMGGVDFLRDIAVPTMTGAAETAGKPPPRFVAMVPVLLAHDVTAGRDVINTAFGNYGQIPSYRATLDRGGANNPSDVAIVGGEEAVETGLRAFAAVGVTDFVAVIPTIPGANRQGTYELISVLAGM